MGGLVAARLRAAGSRVWLATRNAESAASVKASGLRVTGIGGALSVDAPDGRTTQSPRRRVWSKLLLNCSVTSRLVQARLVVTVDVGALDGPP